MQQADIIDNTGEILMLNGFTAEHDDECLIPMRIDIGNGVAKTLNQFGTTFLHG
ncbi:hypothetical protein PAFU01_09340 [Pantoea ananatis]|nr:hypothetical protein PAFU01_09340 [Pantoea ananatis]